MSYMSSMASLGKLRVCFKTSIMKLFLNGSCRACVLSNFCRRKNEECLKSVRSFVTTANLQGLEEFFDEEKNWREVVLQTGRPWEKGELRTRSNQDLHKLWYVLLKEMNMLLTMQSGYESVQEIMPSPERLEKVETSMDNLLDVVKERDEAYYLLETGEKPHPRWIDDIDELGRPIRRLEEEHLIPKEHNEEFLEKYKNIGRLAHIFQPYIDEKKFNQTEAHRYAAKKLYNKLSIKYPHVWQKDKHWLRQYCLEKTARCDMNPDLEELMEENEKT